MPSDGLDAFEAALAENGIDVDSTMTTRMGASIMYAHDPGDKTSEIATVALLYAKAPQVASPVLSVTPLTSTSRNADRVANYSIERSLANEYNAGECSKKAYVRRVADTWTEF